MIHNNKQNISLANKCSLTEGAFTDSSAKRKIFALGFFDGVHLGHQALLDACVRLAAAQNAQTAAITFDRHPLSLFAADVPPLLLSSSDRQQLLTRYGIENIWELPVTKEVMSTSWEVFLEDLVSRGAAGFVCGADFRFGHRGEGTSEKLRRFCDAHSFPCEIVPEQSLDSRRISSTHIRNLIEQGDMATANRFLGHPHILSGEVMPGRQLGRTIGVPTANIPIPAGVIVPKCGVYACRAAVDGQLYAAVTNIGSRPTVGGHQLRAESWLLDFSGDLYGKKLTLEFYSFLRPEEKFDSLEALKDQIRQDAAQVKERITHAV